MIYKLKNGHYINLMEVAMIGYHSNATNCFFISMKNGLKFDNTCQPDIYMELINAWTKCVKEARERGVS